MSQEEIIEQLQKEIAQLRQQKAQEPTENIPYWDRLVAMVAIISVIALFFVTPGPFTLTNTFVGILFFSMLIATDKKDRSVWESISFCGAVGLCFVLTFGIILVSPVDLLLSKIPNVGEFLEDMWMTILAIIMAFLTYRYRLQSGKSPGGAWQTFIQAPQKFFGGLRSH